MNCFISSSCYHYQFVRGIFCPFFLLLLCAPLVFALKFGLVRVFIFQLRMDSIRVNTIQPFACCCFFLSPFDLHLTLNTTWKQLKKAKATAEKKKICCFEYHVFLLMLPLFLIILFWWCSFERFAIRFPMIHSDWRMGQVTNSASTTILHNQNLWHTK